MIQTPEGSNWWGYCDEEMDKLFAEEPTTTDPAKRIEIFHQIDQKLFDEVIFGRVWVDSDI
ncbi:MAG: hypothetical protein R3E39_17605 [Anaerolineae bacterium]